MANNLKVIGSSNKIFPFVSNFPMKFEVEVLANPDSTTSCPVFMQDRMDIIKRNILVGT